MRTVKVVIIFLIAGAFLTGLFAGKLLQPATASGNVTLIKEYYYTQNLTEVRYPPVTVTAIQTININGHFKSWGSIGELSDWVSAHLIVIWGAGWTPDCDDYALRLQEQAYNDGYALSCQLIDNGEIYGKNVSNYIVPHMGNLAIVGNEIYFIESQPEYFRVVFVCDKD